MKNKKGQQSMDFLMTYGWAILVVLVAIGLLAYFGVLNPDKFLFNNTVEYIDYLNCSCLK